MTVVLDEKDADAIVTSVSEEEKGTGAKITGRYLGLHDIATASLSLVDKNKKMILWSDEAGDRSLMFGVMRRGGERKIAERPGQEAKKGDVGINRSSKATGTLDKVKRKIQSSSQRAVAPRAAFSELAAQADASRCYSSVPPESYPYAIPAYGEIHSQLEAFVNLGWHALSSFMRCISI